ncbi:MAG: DUF4422 domain-containing protein, partial [Clostridiales bacterium]|nr:DUF4422 domain-containing protein [Clostridiales bacterium]
MARKAENSPGNSKKERVPDVKIIVAAHKLYEMPADSIYLPVHVGSALGRSRGRQSDEAGELSLPCHAGGVETNDLPYQPDDEGENISLKNPGYCELTGLYWAWKNLDCDYLGLAHYRRHFTVRSRAYRRNHAPMDCVLTGAELENLLPQAQIIVPKKRRYYIETLYSHYAHTHYAEHLDVTREIIAEKYPETLGAFGNVMKQTWGYMFNMYIMEKTLSDAYCEWLFDILFELERRVGGRDYSAYQGRFYGRVSEILFNVWLRTVHERILEVGYLPMEKEDWGRKVRSFLAAKVCH